MQFFKESDLEERKYYNSGEAIFSLLSAELDTFKADAYSCQALGDMLYESARAPLTNSIVQRVFRTCFKEVFDSFRVAGTFESYMTVFRKIFGNDVEVVFTVPAPGKLNIDVTAAGFELFDFIARQIEDNAYVNYEVVDWTPDNIAFQTIKGIETEYELKTMLFEMVPAGIFTNITLTLGA